MKRWIIKLLLGASALTAMFLALLFGGDSIAYEIAWKMIIACAIVFLISFYILINTEGGNGNDRKV